MRLSLLATGRRAGVLRAAAAVVLAAGYLDLILGGVTAAPVLLVAGYIVLVPIAIMAG